jgi:hypothetical protein
MNYESLKSKLIINDDYNVLSRDQKNKIENHNELYILNNRTFHHEALGLQAAQTITSLITQTTLSSFHNLEIKRNIGNGIDSYKNLMELTIKNHESNCIVNMNESINPYRFIYTIFEDFIEKLKLIKYEKYKLVIKINVRKLKQYNMSLLELYNILKIKICKLYTFVDFLLLPENFYTFVIILNDINEINTIKNVYICGIKNIIDIQGYIKNQLNFLTIGTNLKYLLSYNYINIKETTSNNILDVNLNLGIENARKIFIKELSNILNLDINNPNILLIADVITFKGYFIPMNNIGFSTIFKSLLDNMSNEKPKLSIKTRIPYGIRNYNKSISERAITGSKLNIGTGMIDVFSTQFVRIIHFPVDKEKIIIHNNSMVLNNNNEIIIDVISNLKFSDMFVKKTFFEYIRLHKYWYIKIIKVCFSILDITINNFITYKVENNSVELKIPSINFDKTNIFNTNINYVLGKSNCFYTLFILNSNLKIINKYIVSDMKGEIKIKNLNNISNYKDVTVIIKSSDIKISKININKNEF